MGNVRKNYVLIGLLVILLAPSHITVTVRPSLCPTNKIAPHRRVVASARTFAAYYDLLLVPNTPQTNSQTQNPLQEHPQEDQPDDCGEIEDYDENDLSSLTQPNQRRGGRTENRFFFGGLFHKPQKLPAYTTPAQTSSQATSITVTGVTPTKPISNIHIAQRPPYWSGGYFSQNQYQPPSYQEPSDNVKPVHEAADISEVPQTYRPGLVGGPLGHVVGLSQARPTPATIQDEKTRRRLEYLSSLRQPTTQPTYYSTRQRPRKITNDDSLLGSFIGLFLK